MRERKEGMEGAFGAKERASVDRFPLPSFHEEERTRKGPNAKQQGRKSHNLKSLIAWVMEGGERKRIRGVHEARGGS